MELVIVPPRMMLPNSFTLWSLHICWSAFRLTWGGGEGPGIFSGRRGGAKTLFKKKSSSAWAPTHSQVPLSKNKGVHIGGLLKSAPVLLWQSMNGLQSRVGRYYVQLGDCHGVTKAVSSFKNQWWFDPISKDMCICSRTYAYLQKKTRFKVM